jgi:aryl-alcohol dehydrogenase-like predicted oxidoreductase
MKPIRLPGGSRDTTQLGFGCAYLAGGFEQRASVRLVHTALEAGLRHFDTASSYGVGQSEAVLARALGGQRHSVTLASKAGLGRHRIGALKSLIRATAMPFRNVLRPYLHRRAAAANPGPPRGDFHPASVEDSIVQTLRELRTDYLDILLLHEVRCSDVTDELLAMLQRLQRQGVLLTLGLATEPSDIREISARYPGLFAVHQCHWSVLDARETLPPGARLQITHRALMRAFEPLRQWLSHDAAARARLERATDCALGDPVVLSQLLLGSALAQNAEGIVLMSSRRASRVRQNAQAAADPAMIRAGARLTAALLQEAHCPAPV